MADALDDKRAILLRFHGLITVGSTIDEAAYWFISFDRCAAVQLRARVYDPAAAAAYRGRPGQYLAHVCVDGVARAVDALSAIITDEANESGLFSAIWHARPNASGPPGREAGRKGIRRCPRRR